MDAVPMLNDSGESVIYEVAGDAERGNPLDIIDVAECFDREAMDGVTFDGKETSLRIVKCWNSHDAMVAEVELFREIAKSMGNPKLGDWNWPDIAERMEALIAKVK